jgi:hypothetical protein
MHMNSTKGKIYEAAIRISRAKGFAFVQRTDFSLVSKWRVVALCLVLWNTPLVHWWRCRPYRSIFSSWNSNHNMIAVNRKTQPAIQHLSKHTQRVPTLSPNLTWRRWGPCSCPTRCLVALCLTTGIRIFQPSESKGTRITKPTKYVIHNLAKVKAHGSSNQQNVFARSIY